MYPDHVGRANLPSERRNSGAARRPLYEMRCYLSCMPQFDYGRYQTIRLRWTNSRMHLRSNKEGTQDDVPPAFESFAITLGEKCNYRLDASASRIVHQECCCDRAHACFEEGVTQRAWFRNADAQLFHQSRRKGPKRGEKSRTRTSQRVAPQTYRTGKESGNVALFRSVRDRPCPCTREGAPCS
jgi:hypothetical protein